MRNALVALVAICLALPAAAGTLAGVSLPDQVSVGDKTLVLNGLGLREATVLMVDVYVAGLYVEVKSSDPAAILAPQQSKQLVMRFMRSLGKEKLTEAWTEGFDKNAGDQRAALAADLAMLNAAMIDVRKEDRITLTYQPDKGVAVSVRGKADVVIPGADFQRVLFLIWLGPKPPNVSLREGLLGNAPAN